jgi:hypothetical protein
VHGEVFSPGAAQQPSQQQPDHSGAGCGPARALYVCRLVQGVSRFNAHFRPEAPGAGPEAVDMCQLARRLASNFKLAVIMQTGPAAGGGGHSGGDAVVRELALLSSKVQAHQEALLGGHAARLEAAARAGQGCDWDGGDDDELCWAGDAVAELLEMWTLLVGGWAGAALATPSATTTVTPSAPAAAPARLRCTLHAFAAPATPPPPPVPPGERLVATALSL